METQKTTRVHWLNLSVAEQAFVAAYVSNAYSVKAAAEAINGNVSDCKRLLSNTDVRKAITELQSELDDIDFLNEKWVKTQLLHLYPKVIGEEKIPAVDSEGNQTEVNRFYPEIAFKILEYIAPKRKDTENEAPKSFSFNVTMPGSNKDTSG